jgi:glycosyltransferase involved in cell wall biosynthesis
LCPGPAERRAVRVGLVIYGDLGTSSGGFLYDRMLVGALRRNGDEVDVLSLPWRSYGACVRQNFSRSVRSVLLDWQGDVLLQDELNHPSLFLMNGAFRSNRRFPVISIVHHLRSSEQHRHIARALYRRIECSYLRSVDGFLFNSHATRRAVEALIAGSTRGIVVTPGGDRLGPGPSEADILRRCETGSPLRLLFVGNIIRRKGLLTLIDALALVPRHLWHLTIAGGRGMDSSYALLVDHSIAAHGVRENVNAAGPLSDLALAAAFREHHVLAVPSQHEGFGIVYLEAMGFGVVPIGTGSGGASEIIEHDRSGLIVPTGNVRALAAAITDLAGNRGRLRMLALEARRRFRAFPGWQASMDGACRHLHELVRESRV